MSGNTIGAGRWEMEEAILWINSFGSDEFTTSEAGDALAFLGIVADKIRAGHAANRPRPSDPRSKKVEPIAVYEGGLLNKRFYVGESDDDRTMYGEFSRRSDADLFSISHVMADAILRYRDALIEVGASQPTGGIPRMFLDIADVLDRMGVGNDRAESA